MKIKELIKFLETTNPEAEFIGNYHDSVEEIEMTDIIAIGKDYVSVCYTGDPDFTEEDLEHYDFDAGVYNFPEEFLIKRAQEAREFKRKRLESRVEDIVDLEDFAGRFPLANITRDGDGEIQIDIL